MRIGSSELLKGTVVERGRRRRHLYASGANLQQVFWYRLMNFESYSLRHVIPVKTCFANTRGLHQCVFITAAGNTSQRQHIFYRKQGIPVGPTPFSAGVPCHDGTSEGSRAVREGGNSPLAAFFHSAAPRCKSLHRSVLNTKRENGHLTGLNTSWQTKQWRFVCSGHFVSLLSVVGFCCSCICCLVIHRKQLRVAIYV